MTTQTNKKEDDFEFEIDGEAPVKAKAAPVEEEEEDLDIVDDTPPEDRGRTPLPKEIVEELERDELEDYSEKVKVRLKQMKKVWHDERREKERVEREYKEAMSLTQRLVEDNKRLKQNLTSGEESYLTTAKSAATLEMDAAKRAYKEAHEAGNADELIAAQEKLNAAQFKIAQLQNYRPTLQKENNSVEITQREIPKPDEKTIAWQKRNAWWGDPEHDDMTALALGVHQRLARQRGQSFVNSDDYWKEIDAEMHKRFPEYFEDKRVEAPTTTGGGKPGTRKETRAATVVAPATRSTSAKKVVLTQSQVSLAKKLGVTNEQYAREYAKTLEK